MVYFSDTPYISTINLFSHFCWQKESKVHSTCGFAMLIFKDYYMYVHYFHFLKVFLKRTLVIIEKNLHIQVQYLEKANIYCNGFRFAISKCLGKCLAV